MPEIKSSHFVRNFPAQTTQQQEQRQMKEYNVFPEEVHPPLANQQGQIHQTNYGVPSTQPMLNMEEMHEQAAKARAEHKAAAGRISETGKKRIEILSDIGRLKKDVKLGEHTFSLRTLKVKESREAYLATFNPDATTLEAGFEARIQQLARSIYQIDGHDVSEVLGSEALETRIRFLENSEEIVVSVLWDAFQALQSEVKKQFTIANEAQVNEVIGDLKK